MEQSKDIPWYEWLYAATKDGRIWSHRKCMFLKPYSDKDWYKMIDFRTLEKNKTKNRVWRLVASTFIWPSILQVNHKNWVRDDNRIENLEWCTCSENILHSFRVLGRKYTEKQRQRTIAFNKTKRKPVMQLTKEWILCNIYESISQASIETKLDYRGISYSARLNKKFWWYMFRWYNPNPS